MKNKFEIVKVELRKAFENKQPKEVLQIVERHFGSGISKIITENFKGKKDVSLKGFTGFLKEQVRAEKKIIKESAVSSKAEPISDIQQRIVEDERLSPFANKTDNLSDEETIRRLQRGQDIFKQIMREKDLERGFEYNR